MMWQTPGVSAIAVLTLALGIGANTAIYSVVDAVLMRPLPYRDAGKLVTLQNSFRDGRAGVSTIELADYQDQSGVFAELAAVLAFDANLTGGDQPERVQSVGAYANYFEIMGTPALLGRTFTRDEQRRGWTEVAVLSYGLWQRRFGGSPDVLGKPIRIDDDAYTVIGVMPPGFNHPDSRVTSAVDVWLPCGFSAEPFADPPRRQFRFLDAIGRLKPGVDLEQAQRAVATVGARLRQSYPETYAPEPKAWDVRVRPLAEQVVAGSRPGLLILLGAALLVLLIACCNVANLLLARGSVRRREMAIRSALGATRRELIVQLLGESLAVSLVGGALGLLLASVGIDAIMVFAPAGLPRLNHIGVDWRVLAFTTVASVAAGLLFGIIPALQGSRAEPQAAMKEGGAALGGGRRHRVLGALVVGEMALALVLLGGAGLLLRSLWNAGSVKPGFDARGVLTARLWLPQPNKLDSGRYFKLEQRDVFFRQLVERLSAAPGVESAAVISTIPLRGDPTRGQIPIQVEGRAISPTDPLPLAQFRIASGSYFALMRIPLLAGRTFDGSDKQDAEPTAIINASLARRLFPGESAIGKRFRFPQNVGGGGGGQPNQPPPNPWMRIVGVVADIKSSGLEVAAPDELYRPVTQVSNLATGLVVRAQAGKASALVGTVRATLRSIDPELPIFDVAPLDDVLDGAMAARRFTATLLALFAAAALALAALGIYGVLAYAVSQRRREIALRMALGAVQASVLRMVLLQGLRLAAVGIAVGAVGLWAVTRVVASQLFGVSPTDAPTFAAIAGVLVAVALVASWLPAHRAARTSPMTALRGE
jgi:putative ABC transport system permease protein